MNTRASTTVIVGLGQTGLSVARYLLARGEEFRVVDSRQQPPCLAELLTLRSDLDIRLGDFAQSELGQADRLILSPGVAIDHPAIQTALETAECLSDIDLFCAEAQAPIVAITGSNGKSTVTTLVGEMARKTGLRVGVGGNIGVPALDLLKDGETDIYVLELSSFQLEITNRLRAAVACILNLSPDHLDRYPNMAAYRAAKLRIFKGCRKIVDFAEDSQRPALVAAEVEIFEYSCGDPAEGAFGVRVQEGRTYLAYGRKLLLAVDEMKLKGTHNQLNALAALSLACAVGVPIEAMVDVLHSFPGLPHRCQWVTNRGGVDYYNDSKGTNLGATVAAIEGLGASCVGKIILIAGGEAKGADFSGLLAPVSQFVRALVLIGEDAHLIEGAISDASPRPKLARAKNMAEAVQCAAGFAMANDIVLLSPACASFDMFTDYGARGDAFVNAVESLK